MVPASPNFIWHFLQEQYWRDKLSDYVYVMCMFCIVCNFCEIWNCEKPWAVDWAIKYKPSLNKYFFLILLYEDLILMSKKPIVKYPKEVWLILKQYSDKANYIGVTSPGEYRKSTEKQTTLYCVMYETRGGISCGYLLVPARPFQSRTILGKLFLYQALSWRNHEFPGKCAWGPVGCTGPLAGLRGRAPHRGQGARPPEVEEILSFRSQICCFLAQKNHHGFFYFFCWW